MGLHLVELYRSPNIGVFLKANDSFVLVPKGVASSKVEKLATELQVSPCSVSIGGTRLLGPLIAMNNKGILVSHMVEDYEMKEISSKTGLAVERLESKFTAVGNLVVANDHGAVVSPVLEHSAVRQVERSLGTNVHVMTIDRYYQVGAMAVATNAGAAVYPKLDEQQTAEIGKVLNVEAEPSSVNGGIPYVASGLVANSKNAIAGYLTTGPELIFLTRALKV
jgi:translation initiation factor 6